MMSCTNAAHTTRGSLDHAQELDIRQMKAKKLSEKFAMLSY
jgi:hypothetical protein